MYHCIKARGYLGLFDILESSNRFIIDKKLANALIKQNSNNYIPLVISHIDYRADLTVGYITELAIDNKGLYCEAIIDNDTFLEIQSAINEDFIKYFSKASPSPFLYLKSCFPSFSLSHNINSLKIKHVALVDVGARRGTLVRYEFSANAKATQYTCTDKDIYILLACYTRNAIKLANERSELLFTDALLCDEIDDIDFITAGKECQKKSIKTSSYAIETDVPQIMSEHSNISDALEYLGKIASALSDGNSSTKRKNELQERPPAKRTRVNHEPIVHASQTFSNSESDPELTFNFQDEIKGLRNEMKEILTTQSNMFKDFINQTATLSHQANQPNNVRDLQTSSQNNTQHGSCSNQIVPNSRCDVAQTYDGTSFKNSIEPNRFFSSKPPSQQLVENPLIQETNDRNQSQQNSNVVNIDKYNEIQEQMSTQEADNTKDESRTSEELLIQAGAKVNNSEHLINELFKQFVQTTFHVKKV